MKKYLVFLIVMSFATAMAQKGKLKKANNYYNHLSYHNAARIYEELIDSKVDSPTLKEQLAMCYYRMGDMVNAEKNFKKINIDNRADKHWYYYFAQALKQNGKYTESDLWMKKFHDIFPKDLRGVSFGNDPNYFENIQKNKKRYVISNLSINSCYSDFGVYSTKKNDVVFLSARKHKSSIYHEWTWNGKRFLNLYIAEKDSSNELHNPKYFNRKINSRFHEGPLCFSPDYKKVFFTRNNISNGKKRKDKQGVQNLKLYLADISSSGKWIHEKALAINSKEYSVGHPSITKDGKWIYFSSDMPGSFGGADLYKSEVLADGELGKPINLGKQINTEGNEMFPFISEDGDLYFSSDGLIGMGGLDVFKVFFQSNGVIDKVQNLGLDINSQRDDFAFVLEKDSKSGYFSSNREGGKGDDDIYKFNVIGELILKGILTINGSETIIPNAIVQLRDDSGAIIAETLTKSDGTYSFPIETGKEYVITFIANDFESKSYNVNSKTKKSGEIIQNGQLDKIPHFDLYGLITEFSSGEKIIDASVQIKDLVSGENIIDTKTSSNGDFRKVLEGKKINDFLDYEITIKKDGYLSKTVNFKYTLKNPGTVNIHEQLEIQLCKIKIGMDLSACIGLNPIYFDLGKYNIRPDAAVELDKIVKVMNEYPALVVELGSHTDCRSSKEFNAKLSDNRAKASAAYIQSKISNPSRIYGKGYGESILKVNCPCEGKVVSTCSEAEHQKNRRTEFIIKKF